MSKFGTFMSVFSNVFPLPSKGGMSRSENKLINGLLINHLTFVEVETVTPLCRYFGKLRVLHFCSGHRNCEKPKTSFV